jgi:hypothetical protein
VLKWSNTGEYVTFPEEADEPRGADAEREVAAVEAQAREAEAQREAAGGDETQAMDVDTPAAGEGASSIVTPATVAEETRAGATQEQASGAAPSAIPQHVREEMALVSAAGGVGAELNAGPLPDDSQGASAASTPGPTLNVAAELQPPPSGAAEPQTEGEVNAAAVQAAAEGTNEGGGVADEVGRSTREPSVPGLDAVVELSTDSAEAPKPAS